MVHYIIVRKDLPLGVIAAQVTHAAGESFGKWGLYFASGHITPGTSLVRGEPTTAVVLQADDNAHIKRIRRKLANTKVRFVPIYEPDTPWNGQLMAIGILPGEKEDLKHHFKGLQLLT